MNLTSLNPIEMGKDLWPDVTFYRQQREIIQSVWESDETVVVAGNMLGKDFVAAFIALAFFLTRNPCRVVTTSVDHTQLEGVLWGEVRRFIQTSKYPLDMERGGPLVVNHLHLRKVVDGKTDGLSYMMGRVAAKGEGMLGHHIAAMGDGVPRTLFVADEASGVDDVSYERADTWANRKLIIGNPYPCMNFFRTAVKGDPRTSQAGGDVPRPGGRGYYRRVFRIRGQDSPNVVLGEGEARRGRTPSNRLLIPGVLPYDEYIKRRTTWNPVRQCIGLDADFPEGADVLLYPPDWLNLSERQADVLRGKSRNAKTIGHDPGEGSAESVWAVCDDLGLIAMVSLRTPDTSVIVGRTIALMREYNVEPKSVFFDRGGGGLQHADQLRQQGYDVQTVSFGEAATPEIRPRGVIHPLGRRKEERDTQYAYRNRRAEMYGLLRRALDPAEAGPDGVFAIGAEHAELRRQLAPIPLLYDGEGRMELPPKNRRMADGPNSKKVTMTDLIGCSPDRADALVLAVYGLSSERRSYVFMIQSMV